MLKSFFQKMGSRTGILGSLFRYFWANKMWWIIPFLVILVIFGVIIIIGHTTPLGPFIYTIF